MIALAGRRRDVVIIQATLAGARGSISALRHLPLILPLPFTAAPGSNGDTEGLTRATADGVGVGLLHADR